MSGAELRRACEAEGLRLDVKETARLLAVLVRRGVVRAEGGKYLCRHPALTGLRCTLSDRQLLELVGLTQFTVDGRMFYGQRGLKSRRLFYTGCSLFCHISPV